MLSEDDMRDFQEKCKENPYQCIQIELTDGSVYQGILHSFDKDKMNLIMPKMERPISLGTEGKAAYFLLWIIYPILIQPRHETRLTVNIYCKPCCILSTYLVHENILWSKKP